MAIFVDHTTNEEIEIPDAILNDAPENPRARRVRPPRSAPVVKSLEPVEIVCITENRPWIEVFEPNDNDDVVLVTRAMQHKERLKVAEWIADLLVANNHAVRV